MGGLGSGRPSGSGRNTVESCRAIDINRLNREGCLQPGWSGFWQWSRDGKPLALIHLRAEERQIRLSYRVRIRDDDWEGVDEPVEIVRAPCHLGGSRPYFLCPGVVNATPCRRRVVKLYGAGRYFLGPHCYRLAHASQSEDCLDRARRRSNTIRTRLGGEAGPYSSFPQRPKGMWNRTYERLLDKAIEADVQAEELFEVQAGRLLARLDRRTGKRSFWT